MTERGLSKEAWAAITAIAVALISGGVTLATHFWQSSGPARPAEGGGNGTPSAPPSAPPPAPSVAALAGRWGGTATDGAGARYTVEVEVAPDCAMGARCGTIAVSSVPCRGSLYLAAQDGGDFEFRVDDFVPPSAPGKCEPGAGEHLRAQPDGTLLYTTSYDPPVRAVLARR